MAANAQGDDLEYDKPGAERSRRRRGEEDDLDSDLEEDLLQEDWLSAKKNPSEASDEELNDDLLRSDDEDNTNVSGQGASLNARFSLGTSYDQRDSLDQADYADDMVDLGAEGFETGGGGPEYSDEYSQELDPGVPGDQMEYAAELTDGLQDEVLDLEINEDGEFQDEEEFLAAYEAGPLEQEGLLQEETPKEDEADMGEVEQEALGVEPKDDITVSSQLLDAEEVENEAELGEDAKEESDEEDEDDEESGRLRFKSERKDVSVVRLADAGSKRRNIPETLELSEKAKADLMEFEEQERQRKQGRFGGWGRGGGRGSGRGASQAFGMQNFRGNGRGRGRMNEQRTPLIGHLAMQQHSARMPSPLRHPQHTLGPRGPSPFQEHRGPMAPQPGLQQPGLQPLMPPLMAHRSPPPQRQVEPLQQQRPPQAEPPQQRMMNSPPTSFSQQPPQSKNIHINPHFRGPASSTVQAPLMPSVQMQPRPGGAQRFPGPGDFQPPMPFNQPQRPPHFMETFRNPAPPPPPDREPFFFGEPMFPGQQMFDQQIPNLLMGVGGAGPQPPHRPPQDQKPPPQTPGGFAQPAPVFNQAGPGPLGLFQREPPRAALPPQGPQGLGGLNQHAPPPNQPRPFMGNRQPFGQQQGNPFTPPPMPFGMQGIMHGPSNSQLSHHDHMPSHQPLQHHHHQQHHQPQQHRQDLPHHLHQQQHHQQQQQQHHPHQQQHQPGLNDHRPMIHHGQNPFHGNPRQMTPRHQNPQQRNGPGRLRMSAPNAKQQMQILPQRNSNLRELPVAPGNTTTNYTCSGSGNGSNIGPITKPTAGVRQGPSPRLGLSAGRGRGQATAVEVGTANRTVVQTSSTLQDPEEDEETRQYRLKIEEQKRLREQILRRKEMRRQMQAGVRKKELLDRLNAQNMGQNPGQIPGQNPGPQHQQMQQPQNHQPQNHQQQQLQLQQPQQQQRQFPFKQQLLTPNQGPAFSPNGVLQTPLPRAAVKACLQTGPAGLQQGGVVLHQQRHQNLLQNLHHPQSQPQRRVNAELNPNRADSQFQQPQAPQRIMPIQGASSGGPRPLQALGPKPGVKRTVMQRTRSVGGDGLQVPEKVRVVKLTGAHGCGSAPAAQEAMTIPSLTQGFHRKTTGGPMLPQASRGGGANRLNVPSRGRGSMGSSGGRLLSAHQNLATRGPESQACTVSIEGLSTSTTDAQLMNLLNSVGPIQMFKMLPQQRMALARFSNPQHASNFQQSFHRHMIDLSHIDVSLIDG